MDTTSDGTAVTLYWRPGCPWCAMLRRGLARAGIETEDVNIWDDPDAAATVRGVAGGNETVPTVFVRDMPLVNPSVADVRNALAGTPGAPPSPARGASNFGSWLDRMLRRVRG